MNNNGNNTEEPWSNAEAAESTGWIEVKERKPRNKRKENKVKLPKTEFTEAETNYYAILSEANDFDEQEPVRTAGSQMQQEIASVGAGDSLTHRNCM